MWRPMFAPDVRRAPAGETALETQDGMTRTDDGTSGGILPPLVRLVAHTIQRVRVPPGVTVHEKCPRSQEEQMAAAFREERARRA